MTATTVRATVFNVNQFSQPEHQRADLTARMKDSDIVLTQETVDLDLEAFAAAHAGWAAFQVRNGNNDGHANTGVLYRKALTDKLGAVVDHAVVDLGSAPHQPGKPHTGSRERFLVAVKFACGEWFGSFHIFRESDKSAIPGMLSKVGAWCKDHPRATLGVDRNQVPPGMLENTTDLRWRGVGIDGFLTHLKTANVKEFPKGYSDHPGVHADMTVPTSKPGPGPVKPPAPRYLGPAAHTSPGHNKPIHRIVIHSTVSPCVVGGAESIARYFRSQAAGGSAHYVTDPGEEVQVVYDDVIAWHAPPNPNSLGIEMCDIPGPVPGDKPGSARWKALKRSWRWIRPSQQKMLARTARLTAQLCAAYDVPPYFLTVDELLAGKHGVTTHNNVSQAWHESTHWDPGFWPRGRFMRLVRAEHKRLVG